MNNKSSLCSKLCACTILVASLFSGSSLQAATLGYWRMENISDLGVDSSGNGLNLTNTGVASYTLPGSGAGAAFYDPVPLTGAVNTNAGRFVQTESDRLSINDPFSTGLVDFSIESLVRVSSVDASTGVRVIASQWNTSSGSNHSWQFGVTGTGSGLGARNLILQLTANGGGASVVNVDSDFQLTLNTDYYLAASLDFTGSSLSATFYYQDLTNGGTLQSVVKTASISGVFNSTAPLYIGRGGTTAGATLYFDGYLDEVRLSDSALTSSELLIAVPEPSAYVLVSGGMVALMLLRRKRMS